MPVFALICLMGLACPIVSDAVLQPAGMLVWLIDLAAHWQWLFLVSLVFASAKLVLRNPRWGLLFLAVPLPFFTASAQAPQVAADKSLFTVVSANVSLGNEDPEPLIEWVEKQQVDLIALFEVSPEYAMKLGAENDYPHRIVVPSRGPFGIALISRHPMKNVDVIHDDEGIAHIEADLEWQGRTLKAAAVHPMPPIEPRYQVLRDVKLRSLAQIADQGRPAIVVGDMNATPWSTAFDGLEERGLRRATGLKPSWPVVFGGIMGIPIDHVLVSDHWGLVDNEIGPDLASDHYPVIARLALRPISQHRQR